MTTQTVPSLAEALTTARVLLADTVHPHDRDALSEHRKALGDVLTALDEADHDHRQDGQRLAYAVSIALAESRDAR